jgi:hypothetical protein
MFLMIARCRRFVGSYVLGMGFVLTPTAKPRGKRARKPAGAQPSLLDDNDS